jgi:vacuolar-type H+-ATPase subunit I/STV1
MTYSTLFKQYHTLFSFKERSSAFLGGFIFAFIVFSPLFIILAEFLLIYMYLLNAIVILMIFSAMGFFVFWFHLIKKALVLKKPNIKDEFQLNKFFMFGLIATETVVLIIGLLFLFVFIPMMFV